MDSYKNRFDRASRRMHMAINSIRNNIFNRNPVGNYPTSKHTPKIPSESGESLRQLEYQERANANSTKSVVDQSISYADQLRASRTKAKQTSLEKKKLQYNFKKISSQIIRSKTSVTARKAVQAAKREIMRLFGESQQQGLSIIPLELYLKNGRAKLEIGLCKGKKLYDKRADAAKKAANRTIEREFKERY